MANSKRDDDKTNGDLGDDANGEPIERNDDGPEVAAFALRTAADADAADAAAFALRVAAVPAPAPAPAPSLYIPGG